MKKLVLLIFLSVFLIQHGKSQLDEKDTPNIIRATLLYNFAKLVSWPDDKKDGDFVIAVLETPKLTVQLSKKYSGRKVGDQPIVISAPTVDELEQANDIHIVYIPEILTESLVEIITKLEKKNVLVVSEITDGTLSGATINFYTDENMIKYEYDENNATKQDLKIGVTLKSLGTPKN